MNLETKVSVLIAILLFIDVLLEWKLVYGVYPWERGPAK